LPELDVAPLGELPPGEMKLVDAGSFRVGVYNCDGALYAIEDRCSHDDGPVALGAWDDENCTVICPRHGARFDIPTGQAMTMPAVHATASHEVRIEGEDVLVRIRD